jgi:hypothetical protein
MSTTDDNNFVAFSHHGGDWPSGAVFWAFPGEPTYAPDQGFLASGIGNNPHFKIGGQFGGWFYGVQGTGGFSVDADAQHKVWPPVIGNPFFKFGRRLMTIRISPACSAQGCSSPASLAHPSTMSASTVRQRKIQTPRFRRHSRLALSARRPPGRASLGGRQPGTA